MKKGSKPGDLGEANRMLILNRLRLNGSMSKADLARELGMSFPAISANVKILIEQGRVKESGESRRFCHLMKRWESSLAWM